MVQVKTGRRKRNEPPPVLPEPLTFDRGVVHVEDPGWWLALGDTHVPFHDRRTIELAVGEAKKQKAVGVVLNGDVLDMHAVSSFSKEPTGPRYADEVAKGRELLAWLRYQLPKARIVFKEGNHEERLLTYLWDRAPELFGLEFLTLPSLLKFDDFGVELVNDRRVIALGKLNLIHGHEYKGGITAPVNPARGLYLKAKSVSATHHHHQTSEHHEPDIRGKAGGAWSIGCACNLNPRYLPLNKWNHGFALCRLHADGDFEFRNFRVIDGEVV